MDAAHNAAKKKWPVWRTIVIAVLAVLILATIYIYRNFNNILSKALYSSFNESVISDVYELKFENLQVNPFNGSIRVFNATFLPREKPLKEYPYINSSLSLKTETLLLEEVDIRTLLRENRLILNNVYIAKPEIEFLLNGTRHLMLPFKDTTAVEPIENEEKKRPIESFTLRKFHLEDASFHSINSNKEREFRIKGLSILVNDLQIEQQLGEYLASVQDATLSIENLNGDLEKDGVKRLSFDDFEIMFEAASAQLAIDTAVYRFDNFSTKLKNLNIQTRDSIFQVTMNSFDLSYRDESITLKEVSFKPNVTHAVIQSKYNFQHTEFSGSIGLLEFKKVNFDSMLYAQKLFVDEIALNDVKAAIFKDKTKPMDSTRFPAYLGQTISAIKMPFLIKKVKIGSVELENSERKPDSTVAVVKINKGKVEVKNITNLASKEILDIEADAYINGKVRFKAHVGFNYSKSQFNFEGKIDAFNLPDLNLLIQAYTPAKINKGVADEITFSGVAGDKSAAGTMRFLYHNLEVDLELQNLAKWKSSVITFAANTALLDSNPMEGETVPREVKFTIQRDMNKGFVNVIIKSVLNGLKETMIMNKENRKAHKEAKKQAEE